MSYSYNPFTGSLDKVSVDTTVVSGVASHSDLEDLDYASSGHTGFTSTSTLNTHKSSSDHDGRYYTESEIDTISGSLSSEIDDDITTHAASGDHDGRYYTETEINTWRNSTTQTEMGYVHGVTSDIQTQLNAKATTAALNTHKTSSDHDGRYYTESEVDTISGSLQAQIDTISGGGITDHSALSNLDYASSGHTGFQPAGDYTTNLQLTTTSGDIVSQIPTNTISGIIDDATPTLGGNLDTNNYSIVAREHATASGSYEVVNVIYDTVTGTVDAANVPEGTVYLVYT